jgi:cephalosporin hydroxylase
VDFEKQKDATVQKMGFDRKLQLLTKAWFTRASKFDYSYHFNWLGRPIIQFPQDIMAMQEIIWDAGPDLIIETGIARGGSVIFYASMLELLGGDRQVIGIDIDIREHNRIAIENHAMYKRITMLEGSSVDPKIVSQVYQLASGRNRVLVLLDSNHTHDHVLKELELYSPLVKKGSYIVVFDTIIEIMPKDFFGNRPFNKGNNPMTAVKEFFKRNDRFVIDKNISDKLLVTVAPGGYLKCTKNCTR